MKKMKLVSGILAFAFLATSVLGGCSGNKNEETGTNTGGSEEKKVTIGLALSTTQEERWAKESKYFVDAAEKIGAKVVVQDAGNDENNQNNQVENLINQKVDALVIVAANSKTAGTAVESAKKAGIPVMAYSRLIKDVDYDCFIGFDVVDIGRTLAKAAIAKVPKGNYMIMNGGQTDINAKFEHDGYMEVIQPLIDKGDIKLVSDQWAENWAPEKALALAENALTQNNNKIDAALVSNDGMAGGVVQALKQQKLDGKVFVTGTDGEAAALQRIAEGSQSCTLLFPSKDFAEAAAKAAVEMAQSKKVPSTATGTIDNGANKKLPTIYVNTVLVTKENINDTVIKAGIAKVEDVFKNVPKDQWPK
ncbi:MAG: substrate-binding domain-containing protein [Clostridia bacterium]|nr:substrate-binding domain-containing protein [Clostridia bacterium]